MYGGVANYGRSLARPFMLWVASVLAFGFYYFSQRGQESSAHQAPANLNEWLTSVTLAEKFPCAAGTSNRIGEALYLSFRSAFLKLDWSDAAPARRIFGCLYGTEPSGGVIVPLGVSAVALAQAALSAALVFMFLLALRNLLKVR